MHLSERHLRLLLSGLLAVSLLAGCYLRLVDITKPVMTDEAIYLYQSYMIYTGYKPYTDFFNHQPPLSQYLTTLSYALFGVGILQGRLVDLIFSFGSIPLVYIVTRRFWGFKEAVFSTVLYSISFGVIYFTKYMWVASAPLFLSLLSTYIFLAGDEARSSRRILLAGFIAGLAFICRYSSALIPAAAIIYLLIRRQPVKYVVAYSAGFLLLLLPFLLVFWSGEFFEQTVLYHLNKQGLRPVDRVPAVLIALTNHYPEIFLVGFLGLIVTALSPKKTGADVLVMLTATLGLASLFFIKHPLIWISALYFSIYSPYFAILAGRATRVFSGVIFVFVILLVFQASGLNAARIIACNSVAVGRLSHDLDVVEQYLSDSGVTENQMIALNYPSYYLPLRLGLHLTPGLEDLSSYRFLFDLTPGYVAPRMAGVRYILYYNTTIQDSDRVEILSYYTLTDTEMSYPREMHDILFNNTQVSAKSGMFTVYEVKH